MYLTDFEIQHPPFSYKQEKGLELLSQLHDTEEKMKWECEDWGLKMTLSKQIPILIGRAIADFVQKTDLRIFILFIPTYLLEPSMEREVVNNAFYDDLGEKWYEAYDHPIALLRAENKARAPWVAKKIAHHFSNKRCSVIDIGCGGGFLSNALAQYGHHVTGIDLSEESLEVARQKDVTHSVFYCNGDVYSLPFGGPQFEVVCAMDLLEHIEDPKKVIGEASRVLKPGGLFFFHTFNRNWFSWLFALKGVEWLVPNTPPNIHLYRLFIKPKEMHTYLEQHSLKVSEIFGLMPTMDKAFFKLLLQRRISTHFSFKIVSSLKCGYMGYAIKN